MIRFERLIAFRLVSHDAAALAQFYSAALGFVVGDTAPIAVDELAMLGLDGTGSRIGLTLAGQVLEIDQFDPPGRSYPGQPAADDRLFQHFAFVTTDMAGAWARALGAGAQPVSSGGPVQLPPENGNVRAVKFRDPEGHPLELLAFPGAQAAQHPLAIDHSAIVVRDVAASMAFYQAHGLTLGDRTLNHGPAQAALDGLVAPQVDVVPLKPSIPAPHLELLGYRDPAPRPERLTAANDVAATRLVWAADTTALITDPDGHRHQCQPSPMPSASPPATG